jgi:hypothetical protein
MKTFCATLSILMLLLFTAGCTSNQVITSLDVAVTATEVALPIVAGATGMSPALTASIMTYLQDADQALALAAQEQSSSDSDQVKAAKILAFFASVKIPNLAGAPAAVVQAIQTIASDIAKYLANYQPTPPGTSFNLKPSSNDRLKLDGIRARALAVREKAQAKR